MVRWLSGFCPQFDAELRGIVRAGRLNDSDLDQKGCGANRTTQLINFFVGDDTASAAERPMTTKELGRSSALDPPVRNSISKRQHQSTVLS
jgi:hypothetical protein